MIINLCLFVALLDWLFRYGSFGPLAITALIGSAILLGAAGQRQRAPARAEAYFLLFTVFASALSLYFDFSLELALQRILAALALVVGAIHISAASARDIRTMGLLSVLALYAFVLFGLIYRDEVFYFAAGDSSFAPHPELLGALALTGLSLTIILLGNASSWSLRIPTAIAAICLVTILAPFYRSLLSGWTVSVADKGGLSMAQALFLGFNPHDYIESLSARREFLKGGQLPIPGILGALALHGLIGVLLLLRVIQQRLQNQRRTIGTFIVCAMMPGGFLVPALISSLWFWRARTEPLHIGRYVVWAGIGTLTSAAIAGALLIAHKERPLEKSDIALTVSKGCLSTFLTAEDLLFTRHHGIDWARVKQVTLQSLAEGRFERGASTIPMQVAKVQWLYYERTMWRKLQQFILGVYIELAYSKGEILRSYLNTVSFGPGGQLGIEKAADTYFRVAPSALTPRQCRILALSIPDPISFNGSTQPLPPVVLARERELQLRSARFSQYLTRQIASQKLTND